MPHKHKRKREEDKSNFDLPPSAKARPLAVRATQKDEAESKRRKPNISKKQRLEQDDTPKAFARLMAFHKTGKRPSSGPDDGSKKKTKKQSKSKSSSDETTTTAPTPTPTSETTQPAAPLPKIQPGERLSDFNIRVNQTLPLSSVPKHSTKSTLAGVKTPLTRHNKRLARMQSEWRATDARLRQQREDELADAADDAEEHSLLWIGVGTGSKKKRRQLADDADPWKVLEKKRKLEGADRQKNLQDVVMAPPVLKQVKRIFRETPVGVGGKPPAVGV